MHYGELVFFLDNSLQLTGLLSCHSSRKRTIGIKRVHFCKYGTKSLVHLKGTNPMRKYKSYAEMYISESPQMKIVKKLREFNL